MAGEKSMAYFIVLLEILLVFFVPLRQYFGPRNEFEVMFCIQFKYGIALSHIFGVANARLSLSHHKLRRHK